MQEVGRSEGEHLDNSEEGESEQVEVEMEIRRESLSM